MKIVLESARQLEDGVWMTDTPPVDVQQMRGAPESEGEMSVLMAEAVAFDAAKRTIVTEMHDLRVLNIGTTPDTLVILCNRREVKASPGRPYNEDDASFDERKYPGDREFLRVASELPEGAEIALRRLLARVRVKHPGSMIRGKRKNFKNAPDNFWYVVVQPRKGDASITVRGLPEEFLPSSLELLSDRPGYTRFYLSKPEQVEEAFRIVSLSKKKA